MPPPADLPPTAAPVADVTAPLWPSTTVGELYQPGEVRAYRFTQDGQEIGRSYGRYEGSASDPATGRIEHTFSTRIELTLPDRPPVRSEGEIVIDDLGQLIRGFERSDAAELRFEAGGNDSLTITDGREQEVLTYRPGDGYMAYMATLHEELMFAVHELPQGEHERRLISLSGGMPRQWTGTARAEAAGVVVETNLGETVRLDKRRIVSIEVPDDGLRVEAIDGSPSWPTWSIVERGELAYQPPANARFDIVPIDLPGRANDTPLAGEILLPHGDDKVPVALFISAAGLSDRYGFAGPPAVDLGEHEITDALAQAGFAVVRYDHPGFGESPAREVSWLAQLEDARRALRSALVHPRVDSQRAVLVGHGEGGWKALRLAAEYDPLVRGVALLATPGRTYAELLRERGEAFQATLPAEVQSQARKQYEQMLDDLEHRRGTPSEFAKQAQWLYEILDEDPAQLLSAVNCPVWIAQGGKDFETDPEVAPAHLRVAAKRKQVSERHYPELDHLFKHEPGESTPARYLEQRSVDATFLSDMTTWAREVVRLAR